MALAIALVLIVVLAVGFHFVSPWWITPIASNWVRMDDTLIAMAIAPATSRTTAAWNGG